MPSSPSVLRCFEPKLDVSLLVFTWTRNCEIYYCRRDRAMTGLLSGVVLVLVMCHSPRTFLNIKVSYKSFSKSTNKNKWTLRNGKRNLSYFGIHSSGMDNSIHIEKEYQIFTSFLKYIIRKDSFIYIKELSKRWQRLERWILDKEKIKFYLLFFLFNL